MELPLQSKRHHQKPRIGSKYQVDVPSFKSSARIKSQEYNTRDHLYACGLEVPITRIAIDSQFSSRKRKLSADQASSSYASIVNLRSLDAQDVHISNAADVDLNGGRDNGSKDANSCASSSKEKFVTWNQDCATTEDGCQGAGDEEGQAVAILPKKRKKKRSCKRNCWQPKRRVSKKPRLEIYSVHCVEEDDEEEGSDFKRKIVPGARPESWKRAEASYFRLAIFLLGKRFCEISKFIGSKRVIEVSDYYYSKFYGRPAWARWKASKSFKCKIAVRGELILEGGRQIELLRRLKLVASDDAYREIMKATSDFNVHLPEPHPSDENKVAEYLRRKEEKLDAYVFKLKDVVGLELLEKCIGLGGPREGHMSKRDLTSGPYPPLHSLLPRHLKEKHSRGAGKSQHTSLVLVGSENLWSRRSEDSLQSTLSVGENWLRKRTCSPEEIVQHFWDQVWPALERGGWKTIERKLTIKSSPRLLFLRPGVDKLHREERGISYFDDVNQVIEAVNDDPGLRQLYELLAEEPLDGSDAPDEEEEVRGGWSDDEDMFTTLDGKRTIVPPTIPSARARTKEESSQSSSLDIDLNRTLCVVNSKPQQGSDSRNEASVERIRVTQSVCEKNPGFPLGTIDLNLLPVDDDCIADAGATTDNWDRLECEFLDCSSIRKEAEPEPVSVLVEVAHPETELTLSLGPCPSPLLTECIEDDSVHLESTEEGTGTNQFTTSFQFPRPVFSHRTESPSRKRSLSYQGSIGQGEWFDNGKELISLPKKRAITLDWIPRGLGELPVTSFLIRMNIAAVAQFYPEVSSSIAAMPAECWRPTSSTDMQLPFEGLQKVIQDSASHLLSSARRLRVESSFGAFLKACQDTTSYSWTQCSRSAIMPGFLEPSRKTVEDCTVWGEVNSKDEHKRISVSNVEEDIGVHELGTTVSSQESTKNIMDNPASFEWNSPPMLMGSSQDAFQEDTQGTAPQITSSHRRRSSPMAGFWQPRARVLDPNTNPSDEQERVQVPEDGHHEESPTLKPPQIQVKSIRFHFKEQGDRPVASKERSKRVPRNYSSGFKLPKPSVWLRCDHGDFSSISESFNSCLTTDSFPANGRVEEGAPQAAQLRVKSEDNDVMVSPSSSVRSWGTADEDEEFYSEDNEEEKPFQAECKTSREMYSASAACDFFDSSLYKPRKRRCATSISRRRGLQDTYLSVDSEKRFSSDELNISDVSAETTGKRIKVSRGALVLKTRSAVGDMYRDGFEVLPGQAEEDQGVDCASKKAKDKRSKPKYQIRNVSCERFLIMLYTESVEEELPLQNRSSQGPFLAPSHLPHLRGARPNKVRRRRPLLPCRSKNMVPQSTDLKASSSAPPKRLGGSPIVPMEEEATSAVATVKWPEQDSRFTLRRTLSDLYAKSGRHCTKRGGGRWQHCCPGC